MTDRSAQALEPSGHTIDGTPWEEPRGPHLPDALTRVPKIIWPFVTLAALEVFRSFQTISSDPVISLSSALLFGLASVTSVTAPLLGAAYFWSHRDRGSIQPAIVGAVLLLALEQLLRTGDTLVLGAIETVLPTGDDFGADIARSMLFSVVATLVGVTGLAFLWVGLRRARGRPDARGQQRLTWVVFAIALAPVVLTAWLIVAPIVTLSGIVPGGSLGEPMQLPNVMAWFTGVVLMALASAGATTTLLGGARAGEKPRIAWRLAAASFVIALFAMIPVELVYYLIHPLSLEGLTAMSWVMSSVTATSSLLLLAAFALGLPAVDLAETETEIGLPATR